eukprot:XP_001701195.1 predicted protein [Chlamydomonas reinhardtii]
MESIKGHPEYVETVFGEAIVARDESLVVLAGASGLGPPDLCWLQKAPKSALTGATGEAKGYYHYVLGGNASSSAAVAAYFATLTAMVEPPTFLQGLFSTSETRIERGFYCCYDPLSRLDVRCELCIPGGVVCGALDCEGNVHDVTPDLWRNCVAAFLRSELYDAELVSHPPLPTPSDESRLLSAVAGLYEDGVLPQGLEALTVDQAGGVAPEHSDVVLHCLLHYLARRQRWGTALEFFARLCSSYPPAALYVAAVQRECGLYDDALATLSRAVEEAPAEPLLLAALATECLYSDQAVLAAVYTVLQELVAVSGWDGFLQLRGGVFVMHADSVDFESQLDEAVAMGLSDFPEHLEEQQQQLLQAVSPGGGAEEAHGTTPSAAAGAGVGVAAGQQGPLGSDGFPLVLQNADADRQAFLDWKALDTELAEAGCAGSHAAIVAGIAPPPSAADYARAREQQQQPAAVTTRLLYHCAGYSFTS